jgi:cytoskeletal protein RodZ
VSIPSAPRNLGGHRGKHSKSRGDPWRLPVVIPTLLVLACVVGVVIYALSGGFATHPANGATGRSSSTTLGTLPPLPASSTTTTSSSIAAKSTTTSAPATTTTASTTTTVTTTTVVPPTTVPANQVLVEVQNGSGQPGQAKQVASELTSAGFQVNGTGDATSYNYKESDILYSSGSATAAATLAADVEGAVTTTETPGIPQGEVYLIVGSDYEGLRS